MNKEFISFKNVLYSALLLGIGAFFPWFFNNLKCNKNIVDVKPTKLYIIDDSTKSIGKLYYTVFANINKTINIEFKKIELQIPQIDRRPYITLLSINRIIMHDTLFTDSISFDISHFNFKKDIPELKELKIYYSVNNSNKVKRYNNVTEACGFIDDADSSKLPPSVIVKNNVKMVIRDIYVIPYKGKKYTCYLWPQTFKIKAVSYKDDLIYIDLDTPRDSTGFIVGKGKLQTNIYEPRLDAPDEIKDKIRLPKLSDVILTYEMHSKNEISYKLFSLPYGKKCYVYFFNNQ
jgi:hypothetical protein